MKWAGLIPLALQVTACTSAKAGVMWGSVRKCRLMTLKEIVVSTKAAGVETIALYCITSPSLSKLYIEPWHYHGSDNILYLSIPLSVFSPADIRASLSRTMGLVGLDARWVFIFASLRTLQIEHASQAFYPYALIYILYRDIIFHKYSNTAEKI
jgi:hypothetical protein